MVIVAHSNCTLNILNRWYILHFKNFNDIFLGLKTCWQISNHGKHDQIKSRSDSYAEISLPKVAQTTVFCTNNKTNILLNGQSKWSSEMYIMLSFIKDKEKRFFV